MNSMMKIFTSLIIFCLISSQAFAQCADPENIYSFDYGGKTYEVVKENQTWEDAAACAVERGGTLARIDDESEQNAIFDELNNNASIIVANTVAPDGGGASYIWIGANDIAEEGTWIWDGDNDGSGEQFWSGAVSGVPVNDLFNNWGTEPDNYANQDAAGIGLTQWPLATGTLGQPGQWNDVDHTNTLYYLIEKETGSGINEEFNSNIQIYPNPANDELIIDLKDNHMKGYTLINLIGKEVTSGNINNTSQVRIDLSGLSSGMYLLNLFLEEGQVITKKIVKHSKF